MSLRWTANSIIMLVQPWRMNPSAMEMCGHEMTSAHYCPAHDPLQSHQRPLVLWLRPSCSLLRGNSVASSKKMKRNTRLQNCNYVRDEVFTAVTMKNSFFLDIKTQFVPHRRHVTSPLQSYWVFISQKTTFFIVTAVKTSNLT
jgi:hypothetical protein